MKAKKIILTSIAIIVAIKVAALIIFLRFAYVVPVLMYHSIDDNDKATKLSVSPETFARQMEFLHRNKYNVVGLDEAVSYLRERKKIPSKTVAITFDDGYYNNYKYAYPVLKRYNIPATVFIIVNKIGQPGWLGWRELKEMSDSGLITVGSHTISHLWLPTMGTAKLKAELADSKRILEERLGKDVGLLCYPIGALDDRVKRLVREAGYEAGIATNPRRFASSDDVYAIKRIKISRTSDNLFVFWFETSGYYTWLKEHRDE